MTTTYPNLLTILASLVGPLPTPLPYADADEPPEPDLYVSPSEAEYLQRGVDDVLDARWSL